MKEKQKSIGFKIGLILGGVHLCLALVAFLSMISSHSSTSSLVFIWFFFLDAPLVLFSRHFEFFGTYAPLVQFGVFGSGIWFLIPWVIDLIAGSILPETARKLRAGIVFIVMPLILVGFIQLEFFSVSYLTKQERPEELKKMLNKATSDFLTGKVVFEKYAPGGIRSVSNTSCGQARGKNLLLALPLGMVSLDESYKMRSNLNLSDRKGFSTIEPVDSDAGSCSFLAYRYGEGVYLFDQEGKELWKATQGDARTGHYDGVRFGDLDNDGKPEFALYYRYTKGIDLLDSKGESRWQHPVYALGHLEIANINGQKEIIYTKSNNANGITETEFTFLNSEGNITGQMKVRTESSEFAVIQWPEGSAPNILLSEEGKIRLIDLKGNTISQLVAPGCRTYGELKAITVKFKKEEPAYLAVKKSLHPDLSVLYVYDATGELVFQKTQTAHIAPALAAVPSNETGAEYLLVGESSGHFKAQVVKYSLTRK